MRFQTIVIATIFLIFSASFVLVGNWFSEQNICEASGNDDEKIYANQVATAPIEGIVMNTFPKTNEQSPSAYTKLVFQKIDCKSCVYDTSTDKDGKYKIRLAKGKYRLIVRNGNRLGETYDGLAPNQERIIEAKMSPISTTFNIELVNRTSPEEVKHCCPKRFGTRG